MRVSPGDNQRQHRKPQLAISFLPLFEQDSMNVAFEVIDGNKRLFERERQRLRITDSDQKRAGKARSLSHRERVNRLLFSARQLRLEARAGPAIGVASLFAPATRPTLRKK